MRRHFLLANKKSLLYKVTKWESKLFNLQCTYINAVQSYLAKHKLDFHGYKGEKINQMKAKLMLNFDEREGLQCRVYGHRKIYLSRAENPQNLTPMTCSAEFPETLAGGKCS